jgi:hypothetical protein
VAEFSAQKAAREVHESEQRIAPTRLLCQEAIKGVRLAAEKSRAVAMAIHADDSVLEGGRHVQI